MTPKSVRQRVSAFVSNAGLTKEQANELYGILENSAEYKLEAMSSRTLRDYLLELGTYKFMFRFKEPNIGESIRVFFHELFTLIKPDVDYKQLDFVIEIVNNKINMVENTELTTNLLDTIVYTKK